MCGLIFFFLVIYRPSEGLVYLSSDPSTGRQVPQHDELSSVMNPRALPCIAVKAAMAVQAQATLSEYHLPAEWSGKVGARTGAGRTVFSSGKRSSDKLGCAAYVCSHRKLRRLARC